MANRYYTQQLGSELRAQSEVVMLACVSVDWENVIEIQRGLWHKLFEGALCKIIVYCFIWLIEVE